MKEKVELPLFPTVLHWPWVEDPLKKQQERNLDVEKHCMKFVIQIYPTYIEHRDTYYRTVSNKFRQTTPYTVPSTNIEKDIFFDILQNIF